MNQEKALAELYEALKLKRLSPMWARLEILLGLIGAGVGILFGLWAVVQRDVEVLTAVGGLALFVLGGYLAMAGHRSHLYQSNNLLTSYLAERLAHCLQPAAEQGNATSNNHQ
jgi:hypothetical protein